jgi:hypothetical protein
MMNQVISACAAALTGDFTAIQAHLLMIFPHKCRAVQSMQGEPLTPTRDLLPLGSLCRGMGLLDATSGPKGIVGDNFKWRGATPQGPRVAARRVSLSGAVGSGKPRDPLSGSAGGRAATVPLKSPW